ncbi:hypothetical protein GCM10027612_59030 [Microbispora bryophytorum subsp. camponoti]
MTYTGNVAKGGPADVREVPGLTISKIEVGDFGNNAYLLRCTETGDGLLIDAAAEPERLLDLIGDMPISSIVTTHRHRDHWGLWWKSPAPPARRPSPIPSTPPSCR